jgi:hypothetical protein
VLHKGVHYDTGIVFRGPGYSISSRREALENATVRRELEIIRDDLHANAVRIVGSTLSRLVSTSEIALELGLEVWFSPMYFNYEMEETSAKLIEAASAASRFLSAHPNRVVFVGGSELTLFSKGFFPGNDIKDRLTALRSDPALLRDTKLNDFFSGLVPRLRAEFSGPIVYASLIFEQVDWELFDFIGVDHYRDDRVKDRYVQMLEPLLESAKPVIITEFGMRTYRGAQGSGALGFGVTDTTRLYLHSLPIIGRFVRPRLRGVYERDEALQAREIGETLSELERAGVAGALLSTFTTPQARSDINPRYDLDIDSMSIVKALPRAQHGTSYPDMAWEPKEAFDVVARHFLQQGSPTD